MIVVAGHVCLDVIPQLERDVDPAEGALFEVGPATFAVGGAVGNVGGVLQRLGVPTRLVGSVGRDPFGDVVRGLLAERGGRLGRTDEAATSYSVVISPPSADRYFLHHPGSNDTFGGEELQAELESLWAEAPRLLHFGYPPIMRRTYADGGRALAAAFAEAGRHGVTVSLDMATPDPAGPAGRADWEAFLRRVLPHVDVFAPSWPDLHALLGALPERPTASSVRSVAEACLDWGAQAVFLKLGDEGAYLRTAEREGWPAAWRGVEAWSPNFEVLARGTTGAGDATIAGFLAALRRGEGPDTAVTWASAVGAYSVEGLDASSSIPDLDTVLARIESGWSRRRSRLDATFGA